MSSCAAVLASASAARADATTAEPSAAPPAAPPTPATAPPAEVKPAHRLVWNPSWPRFGILEYGTTITAYEMLAFIEFRMNLSSTPRWQGGILFDDAIRSVLRLHDASGRRAASAAADALIWVPELEPVVASVLPPAIDRFNVDVAWQMIAIDLEAQAFAGLTQRTLMFIAERGRPDYASCRANPNYGGCGGATASFPSGHASTAFAGAGTSCAHHLNLPLYGGGAADIVPCVLTLVSATAIGVLRMMGDEHWATDVLLGAGEGFFFGYGLPMLLHYRPVVPVVRTRHAMVTFAPAVTPTELGARALGVF